MNTEIFGIVAMYVVMVLLAIPLGRYIGKVYEGEPTWPDRFSIRWIKCFLSSAALEPTGK